MEWQSPNPNKPDAGDDLHVFGKVRVLAHLAIKNLNRCVWTREEVEAWLQGMDEETQQAVWDKMNEVLRVVV